MINDRVSTNTPDDRKGCLSFVVVCVYVLVSRSEMYSTSANTELMKLLEDAWKAASHEDMVICSSQFS